MADELRCIKCGEVAEVAVVVETGDLCCPECDGCYTVAEVEATLAGWAKFLPWLKSHPALAAVPVAARREG